MKTKIETLRAHLAHNYPAVLKEAFDLIKRHHAEVWFEYCYDDCHDDSASVIYGILWSTIEDTLSTRAIEALQANLRQINLHMEYADIFDADISPLEAEQRWEHLCSIVDHGERQRCEDAYWHSIAN